MTPTDAICTCSLIEANPEKIEKFQFSTIVVSYPPGSCTIRGFQLNASGLEWGITNKDTKDRPVGFEDSFFEKIPIVLTEAYNGWFMTPVDIPWNLNFQALKLADHPTYEIELGHPLPFFDQSYRQNHFLKFVEDLTKQDNMPIDVEDNFI